MKKLLLLFLFVFSFINAQTIGDYTESTNPTESWNLWIQSPVEDYRVTLANVYARLLGRSNEWTGQNVFNATTKFDTTVEQRGNQRFYNNFITGWGGTGWQLDYGMATPGQSTLIVDNLTVRKRMSVYELLVRRIYAPNGNLLITSSMKVVGVGTAPPFDSTYVTFEDPTTNGLSSFIKGDLIRAQKFNPTGTIIRVSEAEVDTVYTTTIGSLLFPICKVTYRAGSTAFQKGDDVVRIGSTEDSTRQSLIYLASDDDYSPFIQLKSGINSWEAETDSNNTIVWLGNFDGFTHPYFGELHGSGLLAKNVYLDSATIRGRIILTNPSELLDSLGGINADWNSITSRPIYFDAPSGSGLFLSGDHFGFYTGGAWKNYFDNSGNVVVGNIGIGGQGFSWNQSTGIFSITGAISITNMQDVSDALPSNTVMYTPSTPSTRPDGSSLKTGDVWIDNDDGNRRYIRSGGSWVGSSDTWVQSDYTNGTSFPGSPKEGDWHFWTGAEGTYHKNTWYRYTSATWTASGLYGTYITDAGIYTGEVAANKIVAGSGFINNLSILSTLTVGAFGTTGTIQSYGWGYTNGFQLVGGDSPSFSVVGGTITGGTIQTKSSGGNRVVISTDNTIKIYNTAGDVPASIYADGTTGLSLLHLDAYTVDIGATLTEVSGIFAVADQKFIIGNDGTITKVNNLAASSYTNRFLVSDGTSYTPTALTSSHVTTALGFTPTSGSFGAIGTTLYVASTSGGAATRPITFVPITLGAVTYYVLGEE